jgi:hypothetical protein
MGLCNRYCCVGRAGRWLGGRDGGGKSAFRLPTPTGFRVGAGLWGDGPGAWTRVRRCRSSHLDRQEASEWEGAEELPLFVALPRRCVSEAEQLLAEHGVKLAVEDQRHDGAPLRLKFDGELTPVQKAAARALLAHGTGVFVGASRHRQDRPRHLSRYAPRPEHIDPRSPEAAPRAVGRAARDVPRHRREGGRPDRRCKRKPNGRLDVAISPRPQDKVDDLVAGYGHVIVDECHHLPAVSFERVLSEVRHGSSWV